MFSGCNITSITIPEGVIKIELDALGNCGKLEKVTLPQSLEVLERGVFRNCSSLKEITIPQNVTTMGEYLFFRCNNLTDIYNYAVVPQNIPPIHHNMSQITLHVPAQSVEAYKNAHYWREMKVVPIETE